MTLSVIIISFNVRADLYDCLVSLFAAGVDDLQVIVIDNSSHDGSVTMVREFFPQVEVIANETNVGIPCANNQGLARARGEYVLYLNPDTVVAENTLTACMEFMREHSDVGLMGCRVLYPDGKIQYECARNFLSLDILFWETFYLHMLFPRHPYFGKTLMSDWDHQSSRDVPCLIGAFMLGRRALLQELGGEDESVFIDLDDIDLCFRVKQAGWRVFYFAAPTIIHRTGRSRPKFSGNLIRIGADAKWEFFRKHYGQNAARWCHALLLFRGVVRFVISVPLALAARLFPNLRVTLRGAALPSRHWHLIVWAVQKFAT